MRGPSSDHVTASNGTVLGGWLSVPDDVSVRGSICRLCPSEHPATCSTGPCLMLTHEQVAGRGCGPRHRVGIDGSQADGVGASCHLLKGVREGVLGVAACMEGGRWARMVGVASPGSTAGHASEHVRGPPCHAPVAA